VPIDPDADNSRRAWTPCPLCSHLLRNDGTGAPLQCPTCAHLWTIDAIADEPIDGRRLKAAEPVIATIPLGGPARDVATSPDGNYVYVLLADSVKIISRSNHVVATYRTGAHPKNMVVSADATRIYVTGYDGSTSIISPADNSVRTWMLHRSIAEILSPSGDYLYLAHNGMVEGTRSSWISVVTADGATVASVPVYRYATSLGVSPDGSQLYVASRRSSSWFDWRGSISVIDTETYRVVGSIAMEFAPDTMTVSRDGTHLYATEYHKNSFSVINLETRAVTRRGLRDAPIDLVLSPDGASAYVTCLHSLAVIDTAANIAKISSVGDLPRGVRFSVDGRRAYVIDFAQSSVCVLDTADNSVVGTLAVGGHPEAMALRPDGKFLYVTDGRDGTVAVISTALAHPHAE
jgi:YVTN family beta-propeller protein